MDTKKLKHYWISEERKTFKGWDFSYIADRTSGGELPWNYKDIVLSYMNSDIEILDMGTGGGEFLLSLNPPKGKTFATEGYPPNYEICKKVLPKYGIDVRRVFNKYQLPYEDNSFDLIINRHESIYTDEVYRILKPGGTFITQQVGDQNNKELSQFLLENELEIVEEGFNLNTLLNDLNKSNFKVLDGHECFPKKYYFDIGALVYFAKIIEWEFPGFTVEKCFDKLLMLQEQIETYGYIESVEHRFLFIAHKRNV
ncbi:class I SAM-dependent methyltransferase [Evansella sp. AB-P1]|uniref:class I SAM-dependent methyltransferase n=1 Tax=Evansella sp. AB-P1 TaxID=3037653 RepID=UPI00241E5E9D|nr:class I SAM-dependent methyltransferase [Evansella sp. AB-P1]MDG5789801.1 class I SAM-dependent methyltransferase [Evansella sp. AB-P1]